MLILKRSCKNNLKLFLLLILTILISSCSLGKNDRLYKKNDMFYKAKNINTENDGRTIRQFKNNRNNNEIDISVKKDLLAAMGYLPFNEKKALNDNLSADNHDFFYYEYSKKMGVKFKGNENKELLMAIDEWMGTPYLWGGCSEYGIDCSCLIKNIYKDVFDITLNRISFMIFENNVMPVDKEKLRTGDLLAFEMDEAGISHVGIYIKDNKFVHASLSKGVMISSLDNIYYKNRFIAGGRVMASQSIKIAKLSVKDFPEG